jgi:hypothetical protein
MPRISSIVVFIVASICCVLGLELAFRAVMGVPVLSLTNWRTDRLVQSELHSASQYDPVVGWTMKDGLFAGDLNTIAYGIRKNAASDRDIVTGGVLVVGDSFAAGSQVTDEETWPAQLGALTGEPVLNGAVGGYAFDQMVLRASQLFPAVQPKVVILSTQDQGILRGSYSSYGRPKPYYSIDNGKLVLHNSPVPRDFEKPKPHGLLKKILSYSYVADQVIGSYYPERWYAGDDQQFIQTGNDDIEVSCALLEQFRRNQDALGVRPLFVLQYGGQAIMDGKAPRHAVAVAACAREVGLQVVDTFDALRAIAERGSNELKSYYVMSSDGKEYGHMSALGNRVIAEVVAAALAHPISASQASASPADFDRPGDGQNRIPSSEALDLIASATGGAGLQATTDRRTPDDAQAQTPEYKFTEYSLSAVESAGQHGLPVPSPLLPAGVYVLSLEARPDTATTLRLQLNDGGGNSVLADYDLEQQRVMVSRYGGAEHYRALVEAAADGWERLSLAAELPAGQVGASLQLLDGKGAAVFNAHGERLTVRALQLEGGRTPSAYTPTTGRSSESFLHRSGNRLLRSESLDTAGVSLANTVLSVVGDDAQQGREYRLAAQGRKAEHYVVLPVWRADPGAFTLSLEMRREEGARVRLQLLDKKTNGSLADMDFCSGCVTTTPLHQVQDVEARVDPLGDGWFHMTLSATLPAPGPIVIVQLLDRNGSGDFEPSGEAVRLRHVQVEPALSATAYKASSPE